MPSTTHASDGRIVATGLTYATADGRSLFHDLDIAFGRERTGLIGPNGSGKTTLLRLLAGELAPSSGVVHRGAAIAVLPQDFRPPPEAPLAVVLRVDERLAALRRLADGSGTTADVELVGDDWDIEERIVAVLARYGLGHLTLDRPVGAVSGGEATRVALAGLALGRPDFLLLDEPTNHLDAENRRALYDFIESWTGGVLCVSHDRELLRRVDRIVELSSLGVRVWGGNWDAYRVARDAEDAAAASELDSARASVRTAERKARAVRERQARRDAQGRRDRAKGGMPKVLLNARKAQAESSGGRVRDVTAREVEERRERLLAARTRVEERERPRFGLASTGLPLGRSVLELDDVTVRFGTDAAPVLDRLSLRIVGPERVAVVGPNGSGKSTLLQVALGRLEPECGTVRRLPDEEVAFLDQHGVALDPARSVLEEFAARHPDMDPTATRYALARFLFEGEDALRPVGVLSGGQRLRLSLACVLGGARPPSLLVLDEPTNHLDLDAVDALEAALREYDGALLVVSHDAAFLDAIDVQRRVPAGHPATRRLQSSATWHKRRHMAESKRRYFDDQIGPDAPPIHTVIEEEERRRLGIASCALLLELAHADDEFSDAERTHIEGIIRQRFALDADGAKTLIQLAQAERDRGAGLHEFADLMRDKLDDQQKARLVEMMWRLALSDGEIAQRETYLMQRVGGLLGLPGEVLAEARRRVVGGQKA